MSENANQLQNISSNFKLNNKTRLKLVTQGFTYFNFRL